MSRRPPRPPSLRPPLQVRVPGEVTPQTGVGPWAFYQVDGLPVKIATVQEVPARAKPLTQQQYLELVQAIKLGW